MKLSITRIMLIVLSVSLATPSHAYKEIWEWTAQVPECEYYADDTVGCSGSFGTQKFSDFLENYDVDFEIFKRWNNLPISTSQDERMIAQHFYQVSLTPLQQRVGNKVYLQDGLIISLGSMQCISKPPAACGGIGEPRPASYFLRGSLTLEQLDNFNELIQIRSGDQMIEENTLVRTAE